MIMLKLNKFWKTNNIFDYTNDVLQLENSINAHTYNFIIAKVNHYYGVFVPNGLLNYAWFIKMLKNDYINGFLSSAYLYSFRQFKNEVYKKGLIESLKYITKENNILIDVLHLYLLGVERENIVNLYPSGLRQSVLYLLSLIENSMSKLFGTSQGSAVRKFDRLLNKHYQSFERISNFRLSNPNNNYEKMKSIGNALLGGVFIKTVQPVELMSLPRYPVEKKLFLFNV